MIRRVNNAHPQLTASEACLVVGGLPSLTHALSTHSGQVSNAGRWQHSRGWAYVIKSCISGGPCRRHGHGCSCTARLDFSVHDKAALMAATAAQCSRSLLPPAESRQGAAGACPPSTVAGPQSRQY